MPASTSPGRPRHPRTLPLRPLDLRGAPYAKRALAWSPDAELAVAVDDSVYVFVPQWPASAGENKDGDDEGMLKGEGSDDDNDDDAAFPQAGEATETESRSQFAIGSRHIPVAYPPLDGRINDRLFVATAAVAAARGDSDGEEDSEDDEAAADAGPTNSGPGLITSSGSTMRSVAALAWSPAGVGHNRRPVLGVLSADGLLGVYGEADDYGSGQRGTSGTSGTSGGGLGGSSNSYDTARWSVLWAVGGSSSGTFCLPQGRGRRQRRQADRIVSFAWSGPLVLQHGQPVAASLSALLVYATDRNEVVVVSVGRWPSSAWRVEEVGRFDASGPHGDAYGPGHPHFVPHGTAFGVHCSPFAKEEDASSGATHLSCLVAYLADGYIGFRRVVVVVHPAGPQPVPEPAVVVDKQDTVGLCLFLGTDAFLVWEEAVWVPGGGQYRCRGVVATPMVARAFEVAWNGSITTAPAPMPQEAQPHDRTVCDTVYPPPDEHRTNPIQDLILLPPPDPPGPAPLFALVRQSATATNDDWYESNVQVPVHPLPSTGDDVDMDHDESSTVRPQWAEDISRAVHVHVPAAIARMGEDDDEDDDEDHHIDVDDMNGDDDDDDGGGASLRPLADHAAAAADNVYLHRMRLWGVARAPGHGRRVVTAVLVTGHPAQHADRGGWYRDRSRVLFGWSAAGPVQQPQQPRVQLPLPSAEARMWAWMYGGGEDPLAAVSPLSALASPAAVHPLVADQRCSICGAPLQLTGSQPSPPSSSSRRRGGRGTTIACAHGHVFDRCGATGLAIPQPGISRVCGVCGSRTLRAGALADTLAATAADGRTAVDIGNAEAWLLQAIGGDVCGRCGGKFHE